MTETERQKDKYKDGPRQANTDIETETDIHTQIHRGLLVRPTSTQKPAEDTAENPGRDGVQQGRQRQPEKVRPTPALCVCVCLQTRGL